MQVSVCWTIFRAKTTPPWGTVLKKKHGKRCCAFASCFMMLPLEANPRPERKSRRSRPEPRPRLGPSLENLGWRWCSEDMMKSYEVQWNPYLGMIPSYSIIIYCNYCNQLLHVTIQFHTINKMLTLWNSNGIRMEWNLEEFASGCWPVCYGKMNYQFKMVIFHSYVE